MTISRRKFVESLGRDASRRWPAGAPRRRPFRKLRSARRRRCSRRSFPSSGPPYQPVVTLNGWTLPWRMNGDWKEFHLVAEPVVREIAPGMTAHLWGYNGQSPGPTIEARRRRQGPHLRHQPAAGAHHGALARAALPNGMDGVGGLTQPHIEPGKTFVYEFELQAAAAPSCITRMPTRWCRWRWA